MQLLNQSEKTYMPVNSKWTIYYAWIFTKLLLVCPPDDFILSLFTLSKCNTILETTKNQIQLMTVPIPHSNRLPVIPCPWEPATIKYK